MAKKGFQHVILMRCAGRPRCAAHQRLHQSCGVVAFMQTVAEERGAHLTVRQGEAAAVELVAHQFPQTVGERLVENLKVAVDDAHAALEHEVQIVYRFGRAVFHAGQRGGLVEAHLPDWAQFAESGQLFSGRGFGEHDLLNQSEPVVEMRAALDGALRLHPDFKQARFHRREGRGVHAVGLALYLGVDPVHHGVEIADLLLEAFERQFAAAHEIGFKFQKRAEYVFRHFALAHGGAVGGHVYVAPQDYGRFRDGGLRLGNLLRLTSGKAGRPAASRDGLGTALKVSFLILKIAVGAREQGVDLGPDVLVKLVLHGAEFLAQVAHDGLRPGLVELLERFVQHTGVLRELGGAAALGRAFGTELVRGRLLRGVERGGDGGGALFCQRVYTGLLFRNGAGWRQRGCRRLADVLNGAVHGLVDDLAHGVSLVGAGPVDEAGRLARVLEVAFGWLRVGLPAVPARARRSRKGGTANRRREWACLRRHRVRR